MKSRWAFWIPLVATLFVCLACTVPYTSYDPALSGSSTRALDVSGPNGTVSLSGMTGTSLTVTYNPGASITSAKLYVTAGNSTGLVLASQLMSNNAGVWSYTFSNSTFTSGAVIKLDVLKLVGGVETSVPQGTLGDVTSWASFTYGSSSTSYTVTYDSQGATVAASPTSKTVTSPATTVGSLPTPPTKTGYTFGGWYTAVNGGGTAFTATTTVTASLTVYAKWTTGGGGGGLTGPNGTISVSNMTAGNVTVSYTPGASITSASLYLSQGNGTGLVLASQAMSNSGGTYSYTFNHSSFTTGATIHVDVLKFAGGVETNVPQGTLSDVNSWATFVYGQVSTSYTVSYDSQGATVAASPTSQTVTSPATTVGSLPTPPTKTGYSFGGWYTAVNGGGTAFTATTTVTASLTVYAKWNASGTYTVSFDSQGATVAASPTSKTVTSPATTVGSLPTPPTKTGYTFGGWYTAVNGGGTAFTATTTVTASLTVYAKWTQNGTDNLIPLASGMHMTMQFNNKTGGAYANNQIYLTMLALNAAKQWCWVKADGTLQPMSVGDNGQLTKNGVGYANYSLKLSDISGYQLPPAVDSGRVFVSVGSPIYLQVNVDINGHTAYAAPNLQNASDPNIDVIFDWYEFAIANATWAAGSPVGFWGNTTQVDQLSIPLLARVYDKNGTSGGTLIGSNGISESRASLWSAWDASVPTEFKALKGTYRINAPCKDIANGFGLISPHAPYFNTYVDQIWNQYTTQDLVFNMDFGGATHTYTGRVQNGAMIFKQDGVGAINAVTRKPNATEILEASGVLATGNTVEGALQARISAAFNRHVMQDSSLWDTPSAFYQAAPANYYSKFMHDHAVGGGAYGFAYDDVGNFSGALWSYNARAVVIDINW